MSGETPEERFLAEDEKRYSDTGMLGPNPNVGAFIRGYQHGAAGWHHRSTARPEAYRAGYALGVADAARAVDVAKERYGGRAEVRPGTSYEGDWYGVYVGDRAIAEGFYARASAEARAGRYNAELPVAKIRDVVAEGIARVEREGPCERPPAVDAKPA